MTDVSAGRSRAGIESVKVVTVSDGSTQPRFDDVVREEPLQIRIVQAGKTHDIAVTMRTPGNDFELAAGFLFSEGVVRSPQDIVSISYCIDDDIERQQHYNIVNVELAAGGAPALERLERHFAIGSACGICGKAQLESLQLRVAPIQSRMTVSSAVLTGLPKRLEHQQRAFATTGGLHASALFDPVGNLEAIREDVGRHNAMDKLIGFGLLNDRLPYNDAIVLVSGRSSFEIVQKAAVASVPIVCSVSAPSTLAIEAARDVQMTLVGFLRGRRFNVYSGGDRIV
ncbi:MAG: formate dehydrogenase accessory sulfurtransferase FdhD [Candidatus Eremiobacteraeota bacterium]|nr:formate dehydrogenase accessory sulfurtransferase FdhD [Candidatus Eremiobacteraeota bacterium]